MSVNIEVFQDCKKCEEKTARAKQSCGGESTCDPSDGCLREVLSARWFMEELKPKLIMRQSITVWSKGEVEKWSSLLQNVETIIVTVVLTHVPFYKLRRQIRGKPDFVGNLLLVIFVPVLPVEQSDNDEHGADNDSQDSCGDGPGDQTHTLRLSCRTQRQEGDFSQVCKKCCTVYKSWTGWRKLYVWFCCMTCYHSFREGRCCEILSNTADKTVLSLLKLT